MAKDEPTAPNGFTIRRAGPEDARDIASIRVEGWQAAYRGQLDDALLDAMSAESDAVRWREHLESPPHGHRAFVALRTSERVGFVSCGRSRDPDGDPHVAEVYAIYVRPPTMGTGIGRALMTHALEALRADGFAEVILWVLESNVRAHRFYESGGWRREGEPKDDVLDGFAVREVRYRYRFQQ